ncbi:hypothetical protein [Streptomyces syringium]|uniref:hypothetical protein n=1 Tax=Streptomyces syringium TaxID=76729 RepID=UPI00341C1690
MRKPLGERQRGRVRLGRRLALLGAVISFGAFAVSTWARQDWPGPGLAWVAVLAMTPAGVALLVTLRPRPRRAALAALSVAVFFVLAWATAVLFGGSGGNDDVGSAPPTGRVETPPRPGSSTAQPSVGTARPATPHPTEAKPTDPPVAATPAGVAPPPPTGGDSTGSVAMITAVGGLVTAISGCVTAAAALKQANTTARQAAAAAQAPATPDP